MEKIFKIEGMSCQHCVMAVKKELSKLEVDILDVSIGETKVKFDDKKVNPEIIKQSINNAGYIVLE
jgi:copper chaperone